MQKAALRGQLRQARQEADHLRWLADHRRGLLLGQYVELRATRERLSFARAGLLIALPHVEAPPARALVALALDQSE